MKYKYFEKVRTELGVELEWLLKGYRSISADDIVALEEGNNTIPRKISTLLKNVVKTKERFSHILRFRYNEAAVCSPDVTYESVLIRFNNDNDLLQCLSSFVGMPAKCHADVIEEMCSWLQGSDLHSANVVVRDYSEVEFIKWAEENELEKSPWNREAWWWNSAIPYSASGYNSIYCGNAPSALMLD